MANCDRTAGPSAGVGGSVGGGYGRGDVKSITEMLDEWNTNTPTNEDVVHQCSWMVSLCLPFVPHPSELDGWDDPLPTGEQADRIIKACRVHGVEIPAGITQARLDGVRHGN